MKSSFHRNIGRLALLLLVSVGRVCAADAARPTSPLEGTWRWSFTMPDGGKITPTLRVKIGEDGVLTGQTRFRAGSSAPVTNLTIKAETVSFEVVRDRDGQTTITRYNGTLAGDKIQGKMISNWTGTEETYDWEAIRFNDVEGTWKWASGLGGRGGGGPGRGGGESMLTLKRDGDKLSGKYNAGKPGEADIQHGRFRNSEVSFEIERERNGDKTTNYYRGKFSGEDITGRSITDFGGRVRTNEWRAVRAD